MPLPALACLLAYAATTLVLLLFGFHAWNLLRLRRRHAPAYLEGLRRIREGARLGRTDFPRVLVQVPIYQDPAVARRVVDAVCRLDYPRGSLEIQILDDSRDETTVLVDRAVARHRAAGVPVAVLRRAGREGFKAGALAAGLAQSEAVFVAIFDADFTPEPDFLRRALPLFEADGRVACVQGRWRHLNRDQNLLTRAQAVGVDAHFRIQQVARAASGRFLNFNGTAGMWRTAAIHDGGGWTADTLTEDLDLSYRVQLAGWRIVFDPSIEVRAELPPTLGAYKTQQRRWACGSTQCGRKYLGAVWRAPLPLAVKAEAALHLYGYAVSLAMAALVVLMPVALANLPVLSRHPLLWPLWALIWIAAAGPVVVAAAGQAGRGRRIVPDVPLAVLLGLGSSASNAVAVLRGLLRPLRTFERTPKQGGRRRPLAARVPRMELTMLAGTATASAFLPAGRPWVGVAYALTAIAGFLALSAYWWWVERSRTDVR